jgi:hypothetical protein
VPYVYRFNVNAIDLEVILPCNQHNWIDTVNHENNSTLIIRVYLIVYDSF